MGKFEIEHDEVYHNFTGLIDGKEICILNLLEEGGEEDDQWGTTPARYWLNGIYTHKEEHKFKGYATKLMMAAIEKYGEIYISSASPEEHKQRGDDSARELLDDGLIFINALGRKGIIKKEWRINPFHDESDDDYSE